MISNREMVSVTSSREWKKYFDDYFQVAREFFEFNEN